MQDLDELPDLADDAVEQPGVHRFGHIKIAPEPVAALDVWVSAAASLAVALVLLVLTARHWRRESMLG